MTQSRCGKPNDGGREAADGLSCFNGESPGVYQTIVEIQQRITQITETLSQ